MGCFICAISERDWEISETLGVYGNKRGNLRNGAYREFSMPTQYSIIRDLAGMRVGDKVFFHVIGEAGPSRIQGVYVVRETPFFDSTRIWSDSYELFPYRFLFEPQPKYDHLCRQGASISVPEFYELIEQRRIWSLATLENERNIEARSVRKIEEGGEAKAILRLLHRDLRHRRIRDNFDFAPMPLPPNSKPIRECISDIGRYENSIKALLMYNLARSDPTLEGIFGPVLDFMNEVFIAQTTRKSIDIVCVSEGPSPGRRYVICEAKTDRCTCASLSQTLYYKDLFKRRDVVDIRSDEVVACLIGQRFSIEVVRFCEKWNAQAVNSDILLVQYNPIASGRDAHFALATEPPRI